MTSPQAQKTIVRHLMFPTLREALANGGVFLGRIKLVPSPVIQAEIDRRIRITPELAGI